MDFIKIIILHMSLPISQRVSHKEHCGLSSPRTSSPNLSSSSGSENCFKEKSELCKKFTEQGFCPYGSRCKFAHGSHELRQNHCQNSKYKTKECHTFSSICHCKYGDRCNFLHRSSFKFCFSTVFEQYGDILGESAAY